MTNLHSIDSLPKLNNFLGSAVSRNIDHFVLKIDCRFAIFLGLIKCFDQLAIILSFLRAGTHLFVYDGNLRRMNRKLCSHADTLEIAELLLQAFLVLVVYVRSIN